MARNILSVAVVVLCVVVVLLCGGNLYGYGVQGGGGSFFTIDEARIFGRGRIIGTVLDRKGEPIANVSVFAESVGGVDGEAETYGPVMTRSNGRFRIWFVPSGTYKVTAVPAEGASFMSTDTFNVNVFARKAAVVNMTLSAKAPDGAGFVGSSACAGCHSGQYAAWSVSAHAKAHLTPSESTIVAPFDDDVLSTSDGKVKFQPFISGDDYKVILFDLNDDAVTETYTIVRSHGGVASAGKQRFHVKLGNSHYIMPIQYNNHAVDPDNPDAAWVSYHAERWYNDDGTLRTPDADAHSFEQNCEGCHATGVKIEKISDEFVSSSTEIGIACEECHGQGAAHVSAGGGVGNSIVNPRYLSVEAAGQVCGQCHTRVVSKPGDNGANFETGYPAIVDGDTIIPYEVGDDLDDFLSFTKLSGKATPGFWNDDDEAVFGDLASKNNHSRKHHQQDIDFARSSHYSAIGLTCFDCHTAHGVGNGAMLRVENDDNSLCLQCHPEMEEMGEDVANGDVKNVHTKHSWDPDGSGASRCTSCHMPKTAKTAVYTDIGSHVFDIIEPAVSLAMAEKNDAEGIENSASTVIMNSCFSCHGDEDYGVARFIRWESKVVE